MNAAEFLQSAHHMLAGLCQVAGSVDGIETVGVLCDGGEIWLVQADEESSDPGDQADAWLQLLADKRPAFAVGGFRASTAAEDPRQECDLVCGMFAEDVDGRQLQLRAFILEWRPPVLGWFEWPENLARQAGLQ
jgi:hypothetical protein